MSWDKKVARLESRRRQKEALQKLKTMPVPDRIVDSVLGPSAFHFSLGERVALKFERMMERLHKSGQYTRGR